MTPIYNYPLIIIRLEFLSIIRILTPVRPPLPGGPRTPPVLLQVHLDRDRNSQQLLQQQVRQPGPSVDQRRGDAHPEQVGPKNEAVQPL